MRWFYVFTKGIREQVRDYWILVMVVVMAPLFIAIYFLMADPGEVGYNVVLLNQDQGYSLDGVRVNLGDTLVAFLQETALEGDLSVLDYSLGEDRESCLELLRNNQADVLVVLPGELSVSLMEHGGDTTSPARLELVGDVTIMAYIVGAIWTEELIN
ncbi:MAG: hypothetical protein KAT15_15575, partial [Bacteroidales bacterium]|nr:hypothetical protein [Bacteroidales bacterium]